MKLLAVIVALLCAPVFAAEDVIAEAIRVFADAQHTIDAAIGAADTVVVEVVTGRDTKRPLWQSSRSEDVRLLQGAFRIKPPVFRKTIVDGKEQVGVVGRSCFCWGQLWITFKRGDRPLLTLLILHGSMIGSETLGGFDIEPAPLAPFYDRMMALEKQTRPTAQPLSPSGAH